MDHLYNKLSVFFNVSSFHQKVSPTEVKSSNAFQIFQMTKQSHCRLTPKRVDRFQSTIHQSPTKSNQSVADALYVELFGTSFSNPAGTRQLLLGPTSTKYDNQWEKMHRVRTK